VSTRPIIILDANILIRAALGVRARDLINQYQKNINMLAPQPAWSDALEKLDITLPKRGISSELLHGSSGRLDALRTAVGSIPLSFVEGERENAFARIGKRDPDDWPILAAALTLNCPIWTEDQDFFGTGVATWNTELVEIFLSR